MLFYIAIFIIPPIIWLMLRTVSKRRAKEETDPPILLEVCALCHEEFGMSELIEKEVGDYGRVYCFCGECIEKPAARIPSAKGIGQFGERRNHLGVTRFSGAFAKYVVFTGTQFFPQNSVSDEPSSPKNQCSCLIYRVGCSCLIA